MLGATSLKQLNMGFMLLRTINDIQHFFSYHVPIWFSISHYYLYKIFNLIQIVLNIISMVGEVKEGGIY
jgi:hypothetical protein